MQQETVKLQPYELRRALLADIEFFNGEPLEVNSDYLVTEVFPDIMMPLWCRAVGISYMVNQKPLPEFKSQTTIILTGRPRLQPCANAVL